jgi:hypothetical protein
MYSFPLPAVAARRVSPLSTTSSIDVQDVCLSTSRSMDVQGVCMPFHHQKYGRAGKMPFHHQQRDRAGFIAFSVDVQGVVCVYIPFHPRKVFIRA